MYKGKYLKQEAPRKRPALLLASLVLLLSVSVVGTVAYLMHSTEAVTNTFTLGQVPNKVVEEITGNTKNNVKIQNLGDVDAYVRAAVVVNWIDADENIYGAATPEYGVDYVWYPSNSANATGHNESDWTLGADGYYYHKSKVSAGKSTEILFTKAAVVADNIPANCHLSIEIMGQTIQADGVGSNEKAPVEDAWENDKIDITVNQDKTLSISAKSQGGVGA